GRLSRRPSWFWKNTPMSDENGGVVISTREFYSEFQTMLHEIRGIREDLRAVATTLPNHKETLDDHEARIREVEKKVVSWSTAAAVVGALLGGGGGQVISALTGA